MAGIASQLSYDNDLLFDTADLARSVTYNGSTVSALVRPAGEKDTGRTDGVTDELVIFVRKADVSTFAKGTEVVIASETWEVFRRIGGGYLNHELLLRKSGRPAPRRSL